MRYAIQMCERQTYGPPKVVDCRIQPAKFSLDEVIKIAKAQLETAMVPGTNIWSGVGTGAIFIRVVELDEDERPTERVVFQTTLAELER
jgi:hypothetical protein